MPTNNPTQGDINPDTAEAKIWEIIADVQQSTIIIDTPGSVRGPEEDARAFKQVVDEAVQQLKALLLDARINELETLLEGDNTLEGSLLRVPDHPDDVRVVDVSQEWLADELNYRPRRAIVNMLRDRIATLQQTRQEEMSEKHHS